MALFSEDDRAARALSLSTKPAEWAVHMMNVRDAVVAQLVASLQEHSRRVYRFGDPVLNLTGRYEYGSKVEDLIPNYTNEKVYIDQMLRETGLVEAIAEGLEVSPDDVLTATVDLYVKGLGRLNEYAGEDQPVYGAPYEITVVVHVKLYAPLDE